MLNLIKAIFLGYSMNSKTYRVYNLSKHIVEESIDVTFQEPNNDLPRDEEDDAGEAGQQQAETEKASPKQQAETETDSGKQQAEIETASGN